MKILDGEKMHKALLSIKPNREVVLNERYACILNDANDGNCFSTFTEDSNSPRIAAKASASVLDLETNEMLDGIVELYDDIDIKRREGVSLSLKHCGEDRWSSVHDIVEVEFRQGDRS